MQKRAKAFWMLSVLVFCCVSSRGFAQTYGGPPGGGGSGGSTGGNWSLTVQAMGTAHASFVFFPSYSPSQGMGSCYIDYVNMPLTYGGNNTLVGSGSLSSMVPSVTTTSGGATISLPCSATTGVTAPNVSINGNCWLENASLHLTFTWQPKGGNLAADPAPTKLKVALVYHVSNQAQTGFSTGTEAANVNATLGNTTVAASAFGPPASGDSETNAIPHLPDLQVCTVSVNAGVATATLDIPLNQTVMETVSGVDSSFAHAQANTTFQLDVQVPGLQLPRGNSGASGNIGVATTDPSFTRWLPLSFSPQINSQPFRLTPNTPLPAPWGNVNCMYSISLQQEGGLDTNGNPFDPNYDLAHTALLYTNIKGTLQSLPDTFVPAYSITDANGDRLLFDSAFHPFTDVHSQFASGGGNSYGLNNAGPPGALKQTGSYSYAFSGLGPNNLASIGDDLGNVQTCLHQSGETFLIVTDSSSGRKLRFHHPLPNGYLSLVEALGPDGSVLNNTVLTYDTGGHLTQLQVTDPSGLIVYHQETFGYGGSSGDALTSHQQGGLLAQYTYSTDSNILDPAGKSTDRVSSVTLGSASDTSSSDDGLAVTGVFQYTWGPTQQGYNHWGIDARTNTFKDALNNLTTSIFTLTNGSYGDINTVQTTGPSFAGNLANSNQWLTVYSPSAVNPTQVSLYDPLWFQSSTGVTPWTAMLDGSGHVTQASDPLGHTWHATYTAGGYLASVTDPTQIQWTLHYGENGAPASRLTSILDPSNATRMTALYNSYGQPTQVTVPATVSASGLNETTSLSYHPTTGDLIGITNPLGDQITIPSYDGFGDPLSVTVYPDTGNPATSLNPLTGSVVYDAAQQVVQQVTPDGLRINNTWSNGLLTQIQTVAPPQQGGNVLASISFNMDSRGRLYKGTDLVGITSQYRFDKNSHMTQIWDGKGNIARLTYGANGEPLSLIWPGGASIGLGYDASGKITSVTDERGNQTSFVYSRDNRLTDIQPFWTTGQNVHYTYDASGRPLTVTDSSGSRTFVYDNTTKRLQSLTTVLSGLPAGHNTFTFQFTYYPDGKVASISSPLGVTNYAYNAAGAPISLTDPNGHTTTWQYDHAGRFTRQQTQTASGTAIATNYTFGNPLTGTPAVHLNQVQHTVNGSAFWTFAQTRTLLGQLSQQTGNGPQANQNETESFYYDNRGRVTAEFEQYQSSTQSTFNNQSVFSYDLANNLQLGQNAWTYNANNQVTAAPFSSGAPSLTGGTGLAYDTSGNLTAMNGSTLGWDGWGNLTSITATGQPTVSFAYDSAGRRVSKTVGTTTTYYLYLGGALLAELDANGNLTRSYTWGPLGLISDTSSGSSRFYLYDSVGNTRFLLNASGQQVSDAAYTAYGACNSASFPSTPFSWKGQGGAYRDSETGLVLMGARYYAPALGRFISRDPIGYLGDINVYGFCGGDPVNLADPSGLQSEGGGLQFIPEEPSVPLKAAGEALGSSEAGEVAASGEVAVAGEAAAVSEVGGGTLVAGETGAAGAFASSSVIGPVGLGACAIYIAGTYAAQAWEAQSAATENACKKPNVLATRMYEALALERQLKACNLCFTAGTSVQVVRHLSRNSRTSTVGTKPIETIHRGDLVVARNPKTGKLEIKPVLQTTIRHAEVVVTVKLANPKTHKIVETITATREHPFYVSGKGFVPAGGLALGNQIVTRAGPSLVVQSVKWNRRHEGYTVYNVVVEDDHTYFVGRANGGVCVHNITCGMAIRAVRNAVLSGKGASVTVANLEEAKEVLIRGVFVQTGILPNSTGTHPGYVDDFYTTRRNYTLEDGYYHYDNEFDSKNRLKWHGDENDHNNQAHIQINFPRLGSRATIRIFYGPIHEPLP